MTKEIDKSINLRERMASYFYKKSSLLENRDSNETYRFSKGVLISTYKRDKKLEHAWINAEHPDINDALYILDRPHIVYKWLNRSNIFKCRWS